MTHAVQKTITLIVGIASIAVLAGCATANIVVPIPKVTAQTTEPKHGEQVLLVISEQFNSELHESKQLMSNFQYELGKYLPLAIKDSLESRFARVGSAADSKNSDDYDVVVKPVLRSFEAPVPPTVFARTKVKVSMDYHVSSKNQAKETVLSGFGDHEFKSKDDEEFYETLTSSSPDIYYYDPSSGVGANIPQYPGRAGRDAAIALKHCLDDLNAKLDEYLKAR